MFEQQQGQVAGAEGVGRGQSAGPGVRGPGVRGPTAD